MLVLAGLEEVQREQRRVVARRAPLERGADPAVDLAAPAERQPLVRHRAEEVVAEAERRPSVSRSTNSESRCQRSRSPASTGSSTRISLEQVEVEARADDRRVAQEQPVGRVEPVDARGQQRLDRLGQDVGAGAGTRRADELAHEERVAAGALGQRRELVAPRARGRPPPRAPASAASLVRQRAERELAWPRRSTANGSPSGRRVTQTSHGRGAGWRGEVARAGTREASSIQCASSTTISVGISSTRVRNCATTSCSLSRRKAASIASASGVERHLGVERDGEQRQPRRQVGHHRLDPRRELRAGLLGASARA